MPGSTASGNGMFAPGRIRMEPWPIGPVFTVFSIALPASSSKMLAAPATGDIGDQARDVVWNLRARLPGVLRAKFGRYDELDLTGHGPSCCDLLLRRSRPADG